MMWIIGIILLGTITSVVLIRMGSDITISLPKDEERIVKRVFSKNHPIHYFDDD